MVNTLLVLLVVLALLVPTLSFKTKNSGRRQHVGAMKHHERKAGML